MTHSNTNPQSGQYHTRSYQLSPTCVVWSWRLKGCFATARLGEKGRLHRALLALFLPDLSAMLIRPNKAETAINDCHCPGDMAVRKRKVLARMWVGVLASVSQAQKKDERPTPLSAQGYPLPILLDQSLACSVVKL